MADIKDMLLKLSNKFGTNAEADEFIPSGSIIMDSVISNGRGIPRGKFVQISSDSGIGKCFSGDTLVCVDGDISYIENYSNELEREGYKDFRVKVFTDFGYKNSLAFYKETISRFYKIRDNYGREIKCSPEHPLLVFDNKEFKWTKAKDLTSGMTLCSSNFGLVFDDLTLTYEDTDYFDYKEINSINLVANYLVSKFIKEYELVNYLVNLKFDDIDELSYYQNALAMFGVYACRSGEILSLDIIALNSFLKTFNRLISNSQKQQIVEQVKVLSKCPVIYNYFDSINCGPDDRKVNLTYISSVEEYNETLTVYDFTIPDVHEFISNGFISHNTTSVLHYCKVACSKGYDVVYLDIEKGVNSSQLSGIGLDKFLNNKFFLYPVSTFEEAEEVLDAVLDDDNMAYIVIDSITALIPQKALEKSVGDVEPGLNARYSAAFLSKYKAKLERSKSKATFIFINQMRNKLNFRGTTTFEAAGGNAQKFYMDVRLMMRKLDKLEKTTMTVEGKKVVPYGCNAVLWAEKNRYNRPFIEGVQTILFGKGVSNLAAYQRFLLAKGFLVQGGAGYYTLKVPGLDEVKVRGSDGIMKYIRENLDAVKKAIEDNGGFCIIEENDDLSD